MTKAPTRDGLPLPIEAPNATTIAAMKEARAVSRARLGSAKASRGALPKAGRRKASFASVRDAIADTPAQAANLRARAESMQQIAAAVAAYCWTQAEAARRCGVTQPRIDDLLRGRVSRFSLDALVDIATALGRQVRVELEAA